MDSNTHQKEERGYPRYWFTEDAQTTIDQGGLLCFLCQMVLRAAVQVTCGTRFCEECYRTLFSNAQTRRVMCPSCEHDGAEDHQDLAPEEYQPDNFCRNQIKRLTALCEYHSLGCLWKGKIYDRQAHLEGCPYGHGREVMCECGKQFRNDREYQRHLETGCLKHSGASASASARRQQCPACGHGEVLSVEHIEKVCTSVQSLHKEVVSRMPSSAQQAHSLPMPTPASGAAAVATSPAAITSNQYEALLNKYKANTSLITVLFNEVKTCSHKIMSIGENSVHDEIKNLKQRVAVLETLARDLQNKIPSMDRLLQDMQGNNTSGRLNWRIDNISQRMEEARIGTIPALYSQPFFTKDAGYKMCARLYLNGDGIGKDSHMSLFFVLMKGHFDAILSWPFTHRVIMLLLDQSGQGNHVQEKFRPDPNSSSFQRPRSEMNIATGCPRFISKTDLDRRKTLYMKDNTMFIQIIVE